MKRAVSAVTAAALMLSGCGKKSFDMAEDYRDYWDYAFDGGASIERDDGSSGSTQVWTVRFTDVNGVEQTEKLEYTEFEGLEEEELAVERDWAVLNFVIAQRGRAAEKELYDKVISKYFDCDTSGNGQWRYSGDGFGIEISMMNCDLFEPDAKVLSADLNAGSGVKYTGCDLKSWAADKTNSVRVSIFAEDSSRLSEFSQKLAELGGDYTEYTVRPQNFCFELYFTDEDGNAQLAAAGCRVLGDETDARLYSTGYILEKLGRGADYDVNAEGEHA